VNVSCAYGRVLPSVGAPAMHLSPQLQSGRPGSHQRLLGADAVCMMFPLRVLSGFDTHVAHHLPHLWFLRQHSRLGQRPVSREPAGQSGQGRLRLLTRTDASTAVVADCWLHVKDTSASNAATSDNPTACTNRTKLLSVPCLSSVSLLQPTKIQVKGCLPHQPAPSIAQPGSLFAAVRATQ